MASLFSKLADNLAETIQKLNVNIGMIKKSEKYEVKFKYCQCYREYANVSDDLVIYKYSSYNKNYLK